MKVLGVVGSPRKGGNTDILVDKVLLGAQEKGNTTNKIFLNDLNIKPCQACMSCKKTGRCAIDDDMQKVYTQVLESDCLVLGTPIYWLGTTAQMKIFIDRWYALLDANYKTKLKGKSAAIIAVCGAPETSMTDFTVQAFEKMFGFIGIELKGKVITSAREKAEVLKNKSVLEEAFSLGTKL